jgi:glutamine amidotransferase
MCRHFGYLGQTVTLAELVFGAPHSLVVQSYAPADMRGGGTMNVDGFGVGWYAGDGTGGTGGAHRYRRPDPIWQDASFADLARSIQVTGALGAVRSASSGMPVSEAACAPFTNGRWLFSLNGRIVGWPDSAAVLAGSLPVTELMTLDAPTDSALLWAVIRSRLAAGSNPASVLTGVIFEVLAVAPSSRLNLMLTDGYTIWATTVTHALWTRHVASGVLVASEPFDDDPAWQPVPDGSLVVAEPGSIEITPLAAQESPAQHGKNEVHVHQR